MNTISDDLKLSLEVLKKTIEGGDPAELDFVIATQSTTREFRDAVLIDALVFSCAGAHIHMVRHLLAEYGLDPNATSETIYEHRGKPPLMLAVECFYLSSMQLESNIDSQVEVVVQLLHHGARLSWPNVLGETALSYVTHIRIADALLACEDVEDLQKALAHKNNEHERDALLQILEKDGTHPFREQYALRLIERGANIHTVDSSGATALMLAVINNHFSVASMLARNNDLMRAKTAEQKNIWHLLTDNDKKPYWDPAIIEILLSRDEVIDIGVDEIDKYGHTCFYYSAYHGFTNALVKALAHRHKESLEVVDPEEGLTPLHLAARAGNTDLVKMILDVCANADPRSRDDDFSPLHLACVTDQDTIVKMLLDRGADPQARTTQEMTPLHIAASQGSLSTVELLFSHNKDPGVDLLCVGDWSPLHLASSGGRQPALLLVHAWQFYKRDLAREDHAGVVRYLLSRGASVNRASRSSKTALHLAAASGLTGVVRALLEGKGVHIEAKDNLGNTPLIDAALSQNSYWENIVELLAPWSPKSIEQLPDLVEKVRRGTTASVVDFFAAGEEQTRHEIPIFDLIYRNDHREGKRDYRPMTIPYPAHKDSFRWINIPSNNVLWCHDLLTRWFIEDGGSKIHELKALQRALSQHQNEGLVENSTYMRPGFKSFRSPDQNSQHDVAYLYIPFLELKMSKRDDTGRGTRNEGRPGLDNQTHIPRSAPQNEDARYNNEGPRQNEQYCNWRLNEDRIHTRLTLDQFQYKEMTTQERDADQVMSRYFDDRAKKHEREGGSNPKILNNRDILIVDQLWLWILGPQLVVSSLAQHEQHDESLLVSSSSLLASIMDRVNPRLGTPVKSVNELTVAIIEECLSVCDRRTREECSLGYREVFGSSANVAMVTQVKHFEEFKQDSLNASRWIKTSLQKHAVRDGERSNEDEEMTFVENLLDISDEIKLLSIGKDIEDELGILENILSTQLSVLAKMGERKDSGLYYDLLEHKEDLDHLSKWMRNINQSITDLLDHKQRYANAIEARYSREQADSAATGNRILMVFTFVTILFLPLSFLAAFFAIDIGQLPERFYKPRQSPMEFVRRYVIGIGVGTAVAIMVVAFSIAKGWKGLKRLWRATERVTNKRVALLKKKSEGGGVNSGAGKVDKNATMKVAAPGRFSAVPTISRLSSTRRRNNERRDEEAGNRTI
ncbi:hypothetical protein Q7P35_009281 [Cladosporium inversicolor]